VPFFRCYPQGNCESSRARIGIPASPWTAMDNPTGCPQLTTGPLTTWSLRRDSLRSPNLERFTLADHPGGPQGPKARFSPQPATRVGGLELKISRPKDLDIGRDG
jgi:hypothetical protein